MIKYQIKIKKNLIDWRIFNLRYGSLTDIHKGDLIYLSSWNIKNGKYIEAVGVGLRDSYDLLEFNYDDGKEYRLIYRSGNSMVIEKL